MITFTLNGKEVQGKKGQYILQVAQEHGVEIPTLCYHKALEPAGMCRLCMVEMHYGGRVRYVTSCNYVIRDGMEIKTDTEEVHHIRKVIVEMMLARCPEVPVVKKLAQQYGIKEPRFKTEDDDCLLCGLCTRICEKMGRGAISLTGRGLEFKVDTPFHAQTDVCMACGACESICPTGHIDIRNITKYEPRPLLSEWDVGLATRSAVYLPFPQAVPLAAVIDPEACVHLRTGNCGVCKEFCEAGAIDFNQKDEIVEINAGSIIVATGFEPFDPTPLTQYGFGRYPEVYTSIQFERINNATGPTAGEIVTKDGRKPEAVAIIHCVGSRDQNHMKYCSRICCMYSMKFAHLVREKTGAEVYEFYIDIRSPGKGYEEFYNRLQEEGTHFIRGKVSQVTDIVDSPEDEGKLVVVAEDTLARTVRRIPVDMVILSVGLKPAAGIEEIARMVGISLDSDGWINELHPKLGPLATPSDGIFIAGCCQGPKDIPDSVAQGQGAAGEALSLISRGKLEIEAAVSVIDPERCMGCRQCEMVCVYGAISYNASLSVCEVNTAICKGCGNCAATCPNKAIELRHFNNDELLAEVEGLMFAPVGIEEHLGGTAM